MKTEYDVEMFRTRNNTSTFALLVDGKYQLFDAYQDADRMLKRIIPDEDIEDSDFGSFELLPPGAGNGEDITTAKETDLLAYAKNTEEAKHLRLHGRIIHKWLRIK